MWILNNLLSFSGQWENVFRIIVLLLSIAIYSLILIFTLEPALLKFYLKFIFLRLITKSVRKTFNVKDERKIFKFQMYGRNTAKLRRWIRKKFEISKGYEENLKGLQEKSWNHKELREKILKSRRAMKKIEISRATRKVEWLREKFWNLEGLWEKLKYPRTTRKRSNDREKNLAISKSYEKNSNIQWLREKFEWPREKFCNLE